MKLDPICVDHLERLRGVDLRLVIPFVVGAFQFSIENQKRVRITEGLRTKGRQALMVAQGKSLTYRSRHILGEAIDCAIIEPDGSVRWKHSDYHDLNLCIQEAADFYEVKIEWGGNWSALVDAVHWELLESAARSVVTLPPS